MPSKSNHLWPELLIPLLCIAPSVAVGLHGLNRPYDAIPDQDMLWASEALRLIRGAAPSYADHPGAFWPLIYSLDIQVLQTFKGQSLLDEAGSILPNSISALIQVARIQHACITGCCAALIQPVSQLLGTRRNLAIASSLIASFSSAILVAASEIRHEVVSVLFFLLYILCAGQSLKPTQDRTRALTLNGLSVLFFFLAAFAKQQVLLCTPLALIAIASAGYSARPADLNTRLQTLLKLSPSRQFVLVIAAAAPWLIAASPDIDLINLPAWLLINGGLAFSLSLVAEAPADRQQLLRPLLLLGGLEIVLFRILAPGWWSQAVTGFPSWMFRHASPTADRLGQTLAGANTYFTSLFTPHSMAAAALAGITVISLLAAAVQRKGETGLQRARITTRAATWLGILFTVAACSQRVTPRYQIYIFIPILLAAAATISATKPTNSFSETSQLDQLISVSSRALASALLITALISSTLNATRLESFVAADQPEHFICFGQHMDAAMRLTSAGACSNFHEAASDKRKYDGWRGPR